MPRKSMFLGASALLVIALIPATMPASAAPLAAAAQPKDDNRYVNLAAGETPRAVQPDVVTSGEGGTRIEIYGSVGDNEGSSSMDWRTVNAFSHLVSSVPKNKQSYTTLFNSLYDINTPKLSGGKWTVSDPKEVFAPTAAYITQANQYDSPAESTKYIHVLGAKESLDEAYAAKSSLARFVRSGYGSDKGTEAVDYRQCAGMGGCLSGTKGLMHSKYGAFEQARDSQGTIRNNVVWMTSSNLNGSSGSKKSNISIAIYGDQKAYDAIVDGIFKPSVEVAKGNKTPAQAIQTPAYKDAISLSNGVMKGMATDSGVTLLPSPRRSSNASGNTATTDVEAAFLRQRAAASGKSACKVYAVHSLFNATRNGVKDGLGKLAGQGCDVRLVLGDNAISDIVDGYFNMSEDLRELVGRVEFANVHDKTLSYQDNSTATTFGGASNFTGTSLEYDELAFRADNQGVTQAVQDHSERIYQLARGQVTWANPSSVSVSPTSALKVKVGDKLQLSPRVKPSNALVTKTTWSAESLGGNASVSPDGVVTGVSPGPVKVTVQVEGASTLGKTTVPRTKSVKVDVGGSSTTTSAGGSAVVPPTLTMDNYQGPGSKTNVVVTWGSGGHDYRGVVKLQYYSGGWKTYGKSINTNVDGVGKMSVTMGSSKTWRAYGAKLQQIDGKNVPNSTAKTTSAWSINTVRTKSASTTPRLYATSMAKSGGKIPFLASWKRSSGVFRLQMRSSGGSWKTHSTYRIPSGSSQLFFVVPALNTKYWRIATSTGSTKISNTIRVAMK